MASVTGRLVIDLTGCALDYAEQRRRVGVLDCLPAGLPVLLRVDFGSDRVGVVHQLAAWGPQLAYIIDGSDFELVTNWVSDLRTTIDAYQLAGVE